MPGHLEGWWSSAPADENGEVIDDPARWPALLREHPRVALVATDSGEVISTWDRLTCGQDADYRPAPQSEWPDGSVVIVDMDTNELLGTDRFRG